MGIITPGDSRTTTGKALQIVLSQDDTTTAQYEHYVSIPV